MCLEVRAQKLYGLVRRAVPWFRFLDGEQASEAEKRAARNLRMQLVVAQLVYDFPGVHPRRLECGVVQMLVIGMADVQAHVRALDKIGPPADKLGVGGGPLVEAPVDLRDHVVDQPFPYPEIGVGEDLPGEGAGRTGRGVRSPGIVLPVFPDTERAYPELDRPATPFVLGGNRGPDTPDKRGVVFPAPPLDPGLGVRKVAQAVTLEGNPVFVRHAKDQGPGTVGVKVVVEVYRVHVVVFDYLPDRIDYVLAHGREAGVKVQPSVEAVHVLGVQNGEVVVGKHPHGVQRANQIHRAHFDNLGRSVAGNGKPAIVCGGNAVGIEPGVELHSPGMGLGDHPLQGIPARIRSLGSRKKVRPGVDPRRIESVQGRPYLENKRVHVPILEHVQYAFELAAEFLRRSGKGHVQVVDGGDPGRSELAFDG